MKHTSVKPCAEWADKLAARHPDDLSAAEAAALRQHVQTCVACASVSRSYALMESAIRAMPVGAPPAALPEEILVESTMKAGNINDTNQPEQAASLRGQGSHVSVRRKRLTRFANLAAAVLVVGAIIAASILLFGTRHAATTGGNRPVQQVTAQFYSGCNFSYDPGIQQVCLEHDFAPIHQSKVMAGYQITLDSGYIDGVRGVILYHVKKLSNGTYGYGQFFNPYPRGLLSTQQGTALPTSTTVNWLVSTPKGAGESARFFYALDVPGSTGELHLHLDIAAMVFTGLTPPFRSAGVKGPVTFDFAVPFRSARRIANLNHTLIIDGKRVTLERVVVGLSATVLYLQGINYNNYHFSLSVGKWNRPLNPLGDAANVTGDITTLEADLPLLTETGPWTLTITGNGGAWSFHFIVPPAATH